MEKIRFLFALPMLPISILCCVASLGLLFDLKKQFKDSFGMGMVYIYLLFIGMSFSAVGIVTFLQGILPII